MSQKRIGVLVPSSNTVAEVDFWRAVPEGVTVHSARMMARAATLEEQERESADVDVATEMLATAYPDVVALASTGGSFFRGPSWDRELLERMERIAGVPAVATSPAAVAAMELLGMRKVCAVTPYPDDLNELLPPYLEGKGFEFTSIAGAGLGKTDAKEINDQTPEDVYEFSIRHWDPAADGMFCSCTAWRAMEAAERLEQAIGKPVVTSNQATIWAALRKLGYAEPMEGYGRLLRAAPRS